MTDKYPQFEWAPGVPIVDDEDEPLENLPELLNNDDDDDDDDDDHNQNDDENENIVTDHDENVDDRDDASAMDENSHSSNDNVGLSSGNSEHNDRSDDSDNDDNLSYEEEDVPPAVSDAESSAPSQDASADADDEASSLSAPPEVTTELIEDATEYIIDSPPSTPPTNEPNRPPPSPSILRRSKRRTAGRGVHRLNISSRGKYYGTNLPHLQFLQKSKSKDSPLAFLKQAIDICFTQAEKLPRYSQMNAKRGIREFGEAAVAAMFKEFKQLDAGVVPGKCVVAPVNVDKLPPTARRAALEAVNLIKEKRDGQIKG